MDGSSVNQSLEWQVTILERGLSQLGQGIILLSEAGEVRFMTDVAKEMVLKKDGLDLVQGLLKAVVKADDVRLQAMREQAADTSVANQRFKSFYIHRNNQKKPYLLIISKMSADQPAADHGGILIIIKDTHANAEFWQERLKSAFKLTNREADFVVLLTEGRNIKEIGTVMGIAEDTARQYLKSCFKKMEVNKQHELVCLAMDSLRKR